MVAGNPHIRPEPTVVVADDFVEKVVENFARLIAPVITNLPLERVLAHISVVQNIRAVTLYCLNAEEVPASYLGAVGIYAAVGVHYAGHDALCVLRVYLLPPCLSLSFGAVEVFENRGVEMLIPVFASVVIFPRAEHIALPCVLVTNSAEIARPRGIHCASVIVDNLID